MLQVDPPVFLLTLPFSIHLTEVPLLSISALGLHPIVVPMLGHIYEQLSMSP